MPKIKVLTSIFSFDYKHMSAALRLTSGRDTDYVFQAWAQFTLYTGNYLLNRLVLSLGSHLKSTFKNTKACKTIKNPSRCKDFNRRSQIEHNLPPPLC